MGADTKRLEALRREVRMVARALANEIGTALADMDVSNLTRPPRSRRRVDIFGRSRYERDVSGFDFMEQLEQREVARIRKRYVDSSVFAPDLLTDQVRRKLGQSLTDSDAMAWLIDQWLTEDALRSVAAGRVPKYGPDLNALLPDLAIDGYDLAIVMGGELTEAMGHIADVESVSDRLAAVDALGQPTLGPAPWLMDASDYVRELEEINRTIVDGADGYLDERTVDTAIRRLRELAPTAIDDGCMAPEALLEEVRAMAIAAGYLTITVERVERSVTIIAMVFRPTACSPAVMPMLDVRIDRTADPPSERGYWPQRNLRMCLTTYHDLCLDTDMTNADKTDETPEPDRMTIRINFAGIDYRLDSWNIRYKLNDAADTQGWIWSYSDPEREDYESDEADPVLQFNRFIDEQEAIESALTARHGSKATEAVRSNG